MEGSFGCILVPAVRAVRGVRKRGSHFGASLQDALKKRKRGACHVVVLGYLNARVGKEDVLGAMGKYGVPGSNVSGERFLELCSELELVIGNAFLRKNGIKMFTWQWLIMKIW